jgi:transcriptional regulator with XRE-family HTH domain
MADGKKAGRAPAQDWPALLQEYDERIAAGEKVDAIKADFTSETQGVNWGTFGNKLRERRKAQPSTAAEDTTTKSKTTRRTASNTEADAPTAPRDAIQSIDLEKIIVLPEIQQRVKMTPSLIDDYLELMSDDQPLTPVVVFGPTDSGAYFLSEGFHRYEATKRIGAPTITAEIRPGGYDEALDYACEANSKHGLRPSQADRMKSVDTQLTHWPERSSREIARKCGVSQTTVTTRRIAHINTDIVEHPERKDQEIAQQWGVKPEYVGEHRRLLLREELEDYPNTPNDKLSEDFGISLETVETMRAEIYPPQAEEPPTESVKPVQMDTPHEWTPAVTEPTPPVSAPEPSIPERPPKTLEQRALELYTILDQESYSIQTILNAVQEAGGYEVFVNALDSSHRAALLAKMTVALRELAAFHQSFETLVNGPVTTPTISETPADEVQGTDALETCFECGRALTVEDSAICEHCGEMFHGPCLQSHMEQVNDATADDAE